MDLTIYSGILMNFFINVNPNLVGFFISYLAEGGIAFSLKISKTYASNLKLGKKVEKHINIRRTIHTFP